MFRMPVLFVGHGSPMNAIEDNDYWVMEKIAERIQPKAIVSFSSLVHKVPKSWMRKPKNDL